MTSSGQREEAGVVEEQAQAGMAAERSNAEPSVGETDDRRISNFKRQTTAKPDLDSIVPNRFGVAKGKENMFGKGNGGNAAGEGDFEDDFEMMTGLAEEEGGLLEDEEMGLLEGPEGAYSEEAYMMPIGVGEEDVEAVGEEEREKGEGKDADVRACLKESPQEEGGEAQQWSTKNVKTSNVIPDRVPLLPQRDALNATEEYITVTGVNSTERVYAPIRARGLSGIGAGSLAEALRRSKGSLLSTKIDDLLGMVERDQFERALAQEKAEKKRARKAKRGKEVEELDAGAEGGKGGHGAGDAAPKQQLWVEKYAPAGFLDLLSDELINREVVKWIKGWDACVFGRPAEQGGLQDNNDPLSRPEQKIILLAGPPGLGKTTLAHIVAKHCGYKAMEINASDERNGPALVGKVVDAMEMGRVTGDKRPNCIIIDEIDGASGGGEGRSAVAALVKLATAKVVRREASKKEVELAAGANATPAKVNGTQAAANSGKTAPAAKPLTRPVICICNDLYAPVLRPLRDVAKVFVVKPPRSEKLVERLQSICKREKLKADKSTLRGLVEKTECDIRSCLNTMQFISKKQRTMKLSDISSVGAGQKDISVGVFRLWKELLHLRQGPSVIGKMAETDSQRCMRRYNMLSDFGDQDLVLGGLYESLPSIIMFDMALNKTCTVLENIQMVDCIQTRVNRRQEFSLLKYLPACTLRVASVLAGPENPQVRWPRMLQSSRKDMADRHTMLHKWRLGMKPETYASLAKTPAMLDVLPFLPWLTAPVLRPVSRHLYSLDERKNLEKVVDTMLGLGVEFSREEEDVTDLGGERANTNAKRVYVAFNPPLHALWQFEEAEFVVHRAESQGILKPRYVPMPTRQMVLHELDVERIKRAAKEKQSRAGMKMPGADALPSSQTPTRTHFTGAVPTTLAQRLEENNKHKKGPSAGPAKPARKRNWLEQLKDKDTTFTCTQGGTVTANKKSKAEDMAVLYKFHEGYTNAVRKPVRIFDL